jgi:hypothetical protein
MRLRGNLHTDRNPQIPWKFKCPHHTQQVVPRDSGSAPDPTSSTNPILNNLEFLSQHKHPQALPVEAHQLEAYGC